MYRKSKVLILFTSLAEKEEEWKPVYYNACNYDVVWIVTDSAPQTSIHFSFTEQEYIEPDSLADRVRQLEAKFYMPCINLSELHLSLVDELATAFKPSDSFWITDRRTFELFDLRINPDGFIESYSLSTKEKIETILGFPDNHALIKDRVGGGEFTPFREISPNEVPTAQFDYGAYRDGRPMFT